MKIYVLRHGKTELNKQGILNGQIDEALAPEGIEQMKTIQIPSTVTHIYTSPMLRARQTAELVNDKLQVKLSIIDNLKEVNMGTLVGKAWRDIENGEELKVKHRSIQYDYHNIGGESAEDVKARIKAFLQELKKQHQNYEALIVTHGGIIRVMHLLDRGEALIDEVKNISLHVFDLDNIL